MSDDEAVYNTAHAEEESKVKLLRKWAFTINCDLLDEPKLMNPEFYVEGQNVSEKINSKNTTVRQTVWIGALEPKEEDKQDPYNHRHCAVESTAGGISKMKALNLLATFLNINPSKFTCGHGEVIKYSQKVDNWISYKNYMFKTLPGRATKEEDNIQTAVTKLRRRLKCNPTPTQVKDYLLKEKLIAFKRLATTQVVQMINLAIEMQDITKSSDEDDGGETDDGPTFLAKLARLDNGESSAAMQQSSTFLEDVLEKLICQLRRTSIRGQKPPLRVIIEIIAMMIMPLFVRRNNNDHKTRALVFYGRSRTGKSFFPMQLVKANKLHLIATDAKGVGRFEANASCTGFFFDDVNPSILTSTDATTIKNISAGDEASIKIYGKSTIVRGWILITCQTRLNMLPEDKDAWNRRLIGVCFDDCKPLKEYTTLFDITDKNNIEEMLAFLYYALHKPDIEDCALKLKDNFIDSTYYKDIIENMFSKLKYGTNLLKVVKQTVAAIYQTFDD